MAVHQIILQWRGAVSRRPWLLCYQRCILIDPTLWQ
jgi:hypothetical protein